MDKTARHRNELQTVRILIDIVIKTLQVYTDVFVDCPQCVREAHPFCSAFQDFAT
jgi:hypothetical protein